MNDPLSILVRLPAGVLLDPDPQETEKRDVRLVSDWEADTGGVVGWSDGGWDALRSAAAHSDLPRLVIVSLPFPENDTRAIELGPISAKTLLLYGSSDPRTGSRHGNRWQRALPNARLEMVPGGGHDILAQMWPRILSHLTPRRKRK